MEFTVGGDDFVVITVPERTDSICEGIINDFDKKILNLYTSDDRERGYIQSINRQGNKMRYPVISISVAVVSNENRNLISHIQVAEIAAEMKKKAKAIEGSVYVKDKRRQ